ncbi:ABC transporter substrate-binding protein [bacterium]|nr:ABC transporter substrate-binding protein [bacterium]
MGAELFDVDWAVRNLHRIGYSQSQFLGEVVSMLNPARQQKINGYRWLILWSALSLTIAQPVLSQERNHRQGRALIVGELLGRADPRQIELQTRAGSYPVLGSGNSKPFELVNQTPTDIEVKYNNSGSLLPNKPTRIIYKFFESERDLISALILEDVDFAELKNEDSALEVQDSNQYFRPYPQIIKHNTVKLICYNHRNPIFQSKRVRIALAYAIDHGKIKRDILGTKADVARGPFDDRSPFFNSGMNSYKYDPRKAIELLQAEGWIDTDNDGIIDKRGQPFRIDLIYQKGLSIDEAVSRQTLINLRRIKVEVRPRPLPKAEINDRLNAADFDAVLMQHTFENSFESLAEFFLTDGVINYMGYHSNPLQQYGRFYRQAKDPDAQKSIIKSMQSVINLDQPVTFLYFKWVTHYLVNVEKFENFRDTREQGTGELRPFEEWTLKNYSER